MKTLFFILFALFSSLLFCTVFNVNQLLPNNPAAFQFNTIVDAYNASENGDVIMISPGDYLQSQSLNVSKTLTIMGTTQNSTRILTNGQTAINVTGGTVTIKNLCFKCVGAYGIRFTGTCPNPVINNCIFESCVRGIDIYTSLTIKITNCIFRDCTYGISEDKDSGSALVVYGDIANCIFNHNARGIHFYGTLSTNTTAHLNIYNSIFINNTEYGIRKSYFYYYGSVAYNIFYANNADILDVNLGPGNLFTNPLLVNNMATPYFNYFPASASPCINAGNPYFDYIDTDGTRNDIGIFGGPNPWGNSKPVVLDIQLNPNTIQQGGTFDIQSSGQTK